MGAQSILTGAVGLVCLGLGLIMWFRAPDQDHNHLWHEILIVILVAAGGTGLMSTTPGTWLANLINKLSSMIGSLAITVGLTLTLGIIGFFLVYEMVSQIRKQDIGPLTLVLAFLLPFIAGSIPGEVGIVIRFILGWIVFLPAWPVAAGLGLI